MNKRVLGEKYEGMAVSFLEGKGVRITDRNYFTRHGEIDLIGRDGDYIVFFEVKYRSSDKYGHPLEAVTPSKQRSIINASRVYLYEKHISENSYIRYDCLGITGDNIEWLRNAFSL